MFVTHRTDAVGNDVPQGGKEGNSYRGAGYFAGAARVYRFLVRRRMI